MKFKQNLYKRTLFHSKWKISFEHLRGVVYFKRLSFCMPECFERICEACIKISR